MRPGRHRPALSERDLAVLALEREWGQAPDSTAQKLARAQRDLGLTGGAYAMIVNSLIDDPAADAFDPDTVGQLRVVREARRTAQAERDSA